MLFSSPLLLALLLGITQVIAQDDWYTVETVMVFPESVTAEGWKNIEGIGVQNLSEVSLYQEFDKNNSTYLNTKADNSQKTENSNEPTTTQDNDEQNQVEVQKAKLASTSESEAVDTTEVDTPDTSEEPVTSSDQEETPETEVTDEPEVEATEEVSEPVEDVATDETDIDANETVSFIKRVTGSFNFAFASVYEHLPFTQSSEIVETNDVPDQEPEEIFDTDTAEAEEQEIVTEDTVQDTQLQGSENELDSTSEVANVADQTSASSSQRVETDSEDTEATTTTPVQSTETEENPVAATELENTCVGECAVRKIQLSGFGLPIFDSKTSLGGLQFRLSAGAKLEEDATSPVELSVWYSYDKGISFENGGSIEIEDEISNSINGGYYLFALPTPDDVSKLSDLTIEIRYADDVDHLKNLFVDGAWVELFTVTAPDLLNTPIEELMADDGYDERLPQGDSLTLPDDEVINFSFTDDNTDESLIIKSDKATYAGLSETTLYFNVTNTSNNDDVFSLQTYFPRGAGEVVSIEEWQQNKPRKVILPEYQPFVYHCEAGWETTNNPINESLLDISKQLAPTQESNENDNELQIDENVPESEATTTPTATDTVDTFEEVEINTSENAVASDETTELEQTDPIEETSTTTTPLSPENDDTSELETASSTLPFTQFSTSTIIASGTTNVAANTGVETDEDLELAETYVCRNTSIVRTCDSITGESTECRVEKVKVKEHQVTQYIQGWDPRTMQNGEKPDDRGVLKKTLNFFGFGPDKKDVPEIFEVRAHSDNGYQIAPGETKYFKMEIAFPPHSVGEFWIEAIGDHEYGLLDPFWSSQWSYRMPVTIDNSASAEELTEHQVFLELDSSYTDFWSNVNADGSDIRFVVENPGNVDGWFGVKQPENDWYDRNWAYRLPITIQSSQVDSTLIDFPVFVDLSTLGDDFFNNVQADGDDIRVTQSDGETELPIELVDIDTGSNTGELYFKASTISNSVDTTFYIYYDNSSATGYGATATYGSENVWTNGYEAVYHLGDENDSTGNNRDLTEVGAPTQLGGAYDLNGDSDFLQMPTNFGIFDGSDSFVWQVYFNADAVAPGTSYTTSPVLLSLGGENNAFLTFGDGEPGDTIGFRYEGWTTPVVANSISIDTDYHLTFSYDQPGADLRMYLNGAQTDSSAGTFSVAGGAYANYIGGFQLSEPDRAFDGTIYEVRILSNPVSANWVDAEYTNLNTPKTFYATSTSEASPELEEIGEWSHRVPITINAGGVNAPLSNFPVYVDLADLGSEFFANAQADGGDIRITTADGLTELAFDLVAIDTGAETGELHFLAPSISDTVDTTFYLYYGNQDAPGYAADSEFGAEMVWDTAGFRTVYHLEEDASGVGNNGLYIDSTSNDYDADDEVSSMGKSGQLGRGQEIRGRESYPDDYILIPSAALNGVDQLAYSFWINTSQTGAQSIVGAGANNELIIFLQNTQLTLYDAGASDTFTLDTSVVGSGWKHMVVMRDALNNQWSLYVDGQPDNQNPLAETMSALSVPVDCVMIGGEQDGTCLTVGDNQQNYDGLIDEFRLRGSFSDAEIAAEFSNQSDPTSFYTINAIESLTPDSFIELDHWVQHFDSTAEESDIWVQIDSIPAATSTTIYLYYGNSGATSASDEYAPFTYSTTTDLYYVVNVDETGPITMYSLIDNNEIFLDGVSLGILQSGESTTTSSYGEASVVSALGPITSRSAANSGEPLLPISFATTTHVVASNRGSEAYHVFAPFADASVNIYEGSAGAPEDSGAVTVDTAVEFTGAAIGSGNAGIIESDEPILVYHNNANDSIVAYPPTLRDLYGIRSNDFFFSSAGSSYDVGIYCSAGGLSTSTGLTRGAQTGNVTCTGSGSGAGAAVRLVNQTAPITAIQQRDGNGNESSVFLPTPEFGTRYILPQDTTYIAVACAPRFGVVDVEVQTAAGAVVSNGTCTPGSATPGALNLVAGGVFSQGYQVVATNDVPFYIYYEEDGNNDESNTWSAVQARKFSPSTLSASFGAQEPALDSQYEQLSYHWFENIDAQTPTDGWPLDDLGTETTEAESITDQGAINVGDILRLRMNLRANVATGTIASTAFKLQYAEAETCSAISTWADIGDIGSSTAAFSGYGNDSVSDGSIISSLQLTQSTVAGTYEEENFTSFIQTEIGTSEVAEWDWVLEATNPSVNTNYCFRMVRASDEALATYTTYPQLETAGPPLAPTPLVYFNNEHTVDQSPILEFAAVDSSGDEINYQVQVDNDRAFGSIDIDRNSETHFTNFENLNSPADKAPFSSGARMRFTSPSSLSDNTTYWWRVRGRDPDGSDTWGEWSVPESFTTNSAITLSEWFQTTGDQFSTNDLSNVSTSSGSVSVVGSSGTMQSTAISFNDGTDGNAWGEVAWNDTETSGTIRYQVEYYTGSTWVLIPDSIISGNSVGISTSPINLLGLSTETYGTIRLVANFAGSSLSIQDWRVTWGERVSTPELSAPFDHEKVATTGPTFQFVATDPENDDLEYALSYGTDVTFTSSTTVSTGTTTSGTTVNYTLGSPLSNGTTYWWRVRARDPEGNNSWSPWSEPNSFTVDTGVTVSTWFQTTDEQFETGELDGVESSGSDAVEVSSRIGEYGTIVLDDGVWTSISTNRSYNNMIAVGSPEYESDADNARTVRVRNKSADSFEILVDNFDSSLTGTTSVDYIVMEAGVWDISDGSGTVQVIAGTAEDVTEVKSRAYSSDPGTQVVFSPAFGSAPVPLLSVSSDNDSTWVGTHVDDGNNRTAEVTANDMFISLARSFETAVHDPEDVDYIVFEGADGTNDGTDFKSFNSGVSVGCCSSGYAVNYPTAFSTEPAVTVVHNNAENGGDGGFAVKDLQTPSTTSTLYLEVPEMGTGANGHANEVVSIVAFEDTSGFITRDSGGGDLSGTIRSETINFSDGAGPKFSQVYWSDTEPGSSEVMYQIEFESSPGVWELIPNVDLPNNSTGTTTAPIDLSELNVLTYDTIRLVATLSCVSGNCPTIEDWTLEWSEGVSMSGTLQEYDLSTSVATGTIAVAVNGTLIGSTGTVSGGSWTVNNVTAFSGDVVTVFVDGADEADEAVAVFVYDGIGNITGVELFEQHLSLSADEIGTTTNALLASYDYSVSGDEDIFFDVDAQNDLSVCAISGCLQANLYVGSGNTYVPDTTGSGNITTHSLINDGRIELDGNTVRVGGSWENNATLLPETSSVIFTATTTNFTLGTWYDKDWGYRLPITIDAAQIDATVTDFPVYIDLSTLPSSFFSAVRSDGADIRITNSDEISEMPHELVAIDTGAETGELHFRADTISDTTDTTFYIYYGNPTAAAHAPSDPYGRNNVWSNGYAAVYHLGEGDSTASGFYIDATGNGYDGTLVDGNGNSAVGSGQLGRAFDFNGDADYIDTFTDAATLGIGGANAKSISAWAYTEAYNDGGPFSLGTRATGEDYSLRTLTSVDSWRVQHWGTPDHDFSYTSQNQWVHFALDYNGSFTRLYADGVDTSNKAAALNTTNTFDLRIGSWHNTNYFNGQIDEVRIATTSRSADWYAAEHTNQNAPATFYSVGTETSLPLVATSWIIDDTNGLITFNNVTFGGNSSVATWKSLDPVDINGAFTANQGTYDRSSSTITVARNVLIGASGALSGISTTTFDGAVSAQWNDNTALGQSLGYVVIDGSAKTVTVQSDVLANSITIGSNDTLSGGGANTISISGNFTNNNTFSPQTSTLAIVGEGTDSIITTGGSSFYAMTASTTGGGTVSFTESDVTMLDDFTIATGTITLPTSRLSVGGSFRNLDGVFAHNNAEVRFTGSGSEVIQLLGTTFLNELYDVSFTGSGNWSYVDANATTSNTFTISNGAVTFPSGQLSVGRDFNVSGGGSFDHNGGEVLFIARSTDSITTNGSELHDVRVRAGSPLRGGDFDAAWLYRNSITIQASQVDEDLTDFPIYVDLGDFDTSFFDNINADGGDIRITESNGVTEVPREIIAVDTGAETGELYFKAPNLSSTTNSTFYIYYGNAAATDYAITATNGAENVWDDDFLAVYHMEEVNAIDSTSFSKDTVAVGDTPALDTGLFGSAVRITDNGGSDYLDLQDDLTELAGQSGMTISAWVNVTDDTNDDVVFTRGGAGTAELLWDNISGTTNNDTWTFNVDSTSIGGNRVDAAPNGIAVGDTWQHVVGSMAGTNRYIYVDGLLRNTNSGGATAIRANTGGSFIGYWAGSAAFDYDGLIDEYRISRVERNAAWIAAEYANMSDTSSFYTLSLGAGEPTRVFSDSVVTATGDVMLESSTTQFPSTNFLIAGSFTNDAAFNAGSGAVTFNATTTGHAISAGSSTFATLVIDGVGGGWTIGENATATNAINLLEGDSLTVASGITLESSGTFTNSFANASTTWTGATLRLSGSSDFALNSKTDEGDDYNVLSVTGDGDVGMWNSTAATYDTQNTSSIYSQDHAGTDGDLYIFGDYQRESGTEYWTYATDFDGAVLTSTTSRQVNVRVENGASVTASSSTLIITGDAAASTTIDAQAGSFALAANRATVTASYFEMTGTNAAGFSLLGSSTVTLLDNALFTIPSASAALSIDASTIDTNPAAQFFNTNFVTGGGNVNVTLSGSPTSYWWFRDGVGNRYGEAFDNADGDPGSIRWDDSNYQIDVSGVAYADDGALTLGGPTCDGVTNNVRIVVNGGAYTDAVPCNGLDGSYSFNNVSYNGDATLLVYLDTNGGEFGSVITRTPTTDITDLDIYADRVITRHENIVPMTIVQMALYDEDDDSDIRFNAATSTSENTLIVRPDTELYVFATSTFTPVGTVTLESGGTGSIYDGSLHLGQSAIFTGAGTTTYSVGGSIILEPNAQLMTASSTFVMTATTTGKAITSSSTLTFNNLEFTGVGGGWNINTDIIAESDIAVADGTVTGTGDITLTNGSLYGDGLLSLGGGTVLLGTTNTLGGAQGWTFNNLTLGDGLQNGTTTPGGTATNTVSGVLAIDSGHALDAGTSHWSLDGAGAVLVENGTFLEDTSTVRYGGVLGSTVLNTAYYNLIVEADGGTPTYTAGVSGLQVLNNLQVGGAAPTVFTLDTNDPIGVITGDVYIANNGTLVGSNSSTLTVSGNWDNDGAFTSSGGTINFDSADAFTIAAGASAFGVVTISGTGGAVVTESATSTGAWTLSTNSNFTLSSGQRLAVGGLFTNGAGSGATTWTGSTLHLYGAGQFNINVSTTEDQYETLSAAAGTHIRTWNSSATNYVTAAGGSIYSMDHANVTGELYIYGDYIKSSGIDYWSYGTDFDGTPLGGRVVDVYVENGGSFTYSGGSLQMLGSGTGSTTVQVQGGSGTYSADVTAGGINAQNYIMQDMDIDGLTLSGSPTVTTLSNGEIIVGTTGATAMTVAGSVINANPAKNFANNRFSTTTGVSSATNVTTSGASVSSWRFTNHTGEIDGESFDADNGNPGYIVWDDSLAVITISGNVYENNASSISSVCDDVTTNIVLAVDGVVVPAASSTCASADGSYSISGVSFSPNDTLTLFINGESDQGASVSIDPISSIGNMDIYEDHVIVRHEATDPILIQDLADYDSSDDPDIPFTVVDGAPDTLTLGAGIKLIVWDNKTFEPQGNISTGGGSGDALDGTVALNDGATLTFAAAQTHSIGGNLEMGAGSAFTPNTSSVTFTSSGSGRTIDTNESGFNDLILNGTGSYSSIDTVLSIANDMTLTNGALTLPSATTTIAGSLTVTGGSFDANGGLIDFTAVGAESASANGSEYNDLRFSGTGSITMTDTNATTTGAVTIASSTVTLPSGTLFVGSDFRNLDGNIIHNTAHLIMENAGTATLQVAGSDLYTVTLKGSGTFTMTDNSLSLLDTLTLDGVHANLASGTLSIGGSLDASGGTFDNATGTILFNSSDTGETVNPGISDFYNVQFGSASGGWTITNHATATNNFTLAAAQSFTQQSGTRLAVGNVFTNAVGGANTTWTGSTLSLDAGVEYSINGKTSGGDTYETLQIDSNTDIRAWDSSATTLSVDPTSSLYSQDHAGSAGALNIYGDFHIGTSSEYWSYAKDFDGTALGGSSRAVTVSIASGATTTVDGGSLEIIGTASATTTVQNQGSGTFAFVVQDGTYTSNYYAYRNLDVNGLILTGTPTISSLSYGDFALAVNGGSMITLSSSTLSANPSKQINNVRFATTSTLTGFNVNLDATTSNAWRFRDHTGNRDGELYDIDGVGDCGSIRWDDSSCLLVEQTQYRWRNNDGGLGVPNSEWFDAGWGKRKRVQVVNNDSTSYATTTVHITVSYDGNMQSDFEDLRFTANDGVTTLPYWIETYTPSVDADVWISVPSLPAGDVYDAYMYYDNVTATTTSSSTTTFIASDDFEDNDISEYSGDTTKFQTEAASAFGGSYGVGPVTNSGFSLDGIARFDSTVSQGEIIRYMQYIDTTSGNSDEACTLFGVQSPVTANDNYAVCLELFGTDRLALVRDAERSDNYGAVVPLATTTVSYTTGWYEVEIDWQTNDTIDVTLFDSSRSVVATTSATDSTYTSGGFGFTYWSQYGGWDSFVVRDRTDTDPSIFFGGEQVAGGASWNAPQNTRSASFEVGNIARLRVAIENTGLAILDQEFLLEYAPKGAAPSCESVAPVSYTAVPVSSSCGTNAVCMINSTQFTDGATIADLLTGTYGDYVFGEAVKNTRNMSNALNLTQNSYTELEYALTSTIHAGDDFYCLRVTDNGSNLDSYAAVAEFSLQFAPTLSALTLNGGEDIVLIPGATSTITATGTATDLNGYSDLLTASTTFYRSGVGAACTDDPNNCYVVGGSPSCTFTNCSGTSCDLECSADFYYHADPTDEGTYSGEEWFAFAEIADTTGFVDFNSSIGVELLTLRALEVGEEINYGSLEVYQDTGSYNASTTIQNEGNDAIDVEIVGSDLTDGFSSTIPASEQIFATSSFTYSACTYCTNLDTVATTYELDLSKPTSAAAPVTDAIYWGIFVPFGTKSNPHSGVNTFYAISDN